MVCGTEESCVRKNIVPHEYRKLVLSCTAFFLMACQSPSRVHKPFCEPISGSSNALFVGGSIFRITSRLINRVSAPADSFHPSRRSTCPMISY